MCHSERSEESEYIRLTLTRSFAEAQDDKEKNQIRHFVILQSVPKKQRINVISSSYGTFNMSFCLKNLPKRDWQTICSPKVFSNENNLKERRNKI